MAGIVSLFLYILTLKNTLQQEFFIRNSNVLIACICLEFALKVLEGVGINSNVHSSSNEIGKFNTSPRNSLGE